VSVKISKNMPSWVVGLIVALSPVVGGTVFAAESQVDRRVGAVNQARNGEIDSALMLLKTLHSETPNDPGIRNDLAVVLSWAGQDVAADALLVNEEVGLLPDYVLTAYAKTLRNLKRWQDAIQAYDALALRDENNVDAKLGAVMALADTSDEGGTERGMSRLNEIERAELGDDQLVQYYLACGYLNERSRKYIRALDCYNQGLLRNRTR
jgi:tetratricopeptide (TPR) repeat protein